MSSKNPFPIQLAIQGGGAKIVCLLAVVETIQQLQRKGMIRVTRVAGTSAGSIAACVLGAGIDAKVVKQHLQSITSAQLEKCFPAPRLNLLRLLLGGQPLWKTDFLRNQLDKFFRPVKAFTLGDLKSLTGMEVRVVAANLSSANKKVYKDPTDDILDAILDSCGLPYCFRAWGKGGSPVIVDGGICENLPSDELEHFETGDGPVIAIAFDPVISRIPDSLKNFSIALLETAMNNSMARARLRLGTERVFSIGTEIGTFDFEKALKDGLGKEYELITNKSEQFFQQFVTARRDDKVTLSPDTWREQNKTMMKTLGEMYDKQHYPSKIKYERLAVVVTANCLQEDSKIPDYVRNTMTFRTGEESIFCHRVSLIESDHPTVFARADISIINNSTGAPIEIRSLPVEDMSEVTTRGLLLFFVPVLGPNSGSYTLDINDAPYELTKFLRQNKTDEFMVLPLRAEGVIDTVDLVFHWPKNTGTVLISPKTNPPGQAMTPAELHAYQAPPGFVSKGWRGKDIPAGSEFGVDLSFMPSTRV